MILFIVLLAVFVIAAALLFVLGAGIVGAIPLVLAIAVVVWLIWAFAGARSPGEATRQTQPAELLGPGGPDDPDNTRNQGHGEPVRSGDDRA
jgi:hypothetical protein